MIYHTPVLEDRLGEVTPSSAPLGNPGIPLREDAPQRLQFRTVVGVPGYAARAGLNDLGVVGSLQVTDANPFNEFLQG